MKMEKTQSPRKQEEMEIGEGGRGGFGSIGLDLQRNILFRLPAVSYASAACVSRSWNHLCNHFLSRPKLLSALSLNTNLSAAVDETLDEVLSEPIRPDFAILCIRLSCDDNLKKDCMELVRKRLGSRIPVIISECYGAMGSEVRTNEFREVMWKDDRHCKTREFRISSSELTNHGVVLIVGFMPGMKVSVLPFLQPSKEHPEDCVTEKFVTDIEDYTNSVSGCTSPVGILMFADTFSDMKPLLDKLDYALSDETVIMGGEAGCFLYSTGDDDTILGGCRHYREIHNCKCTAVALVFATDRDKSHGCGEIKFNLAISNGLSPIGPMYEGDEVGVTRYERFPSSTWLNARRKGSLEKLNGYLLLKHTYGEMDEKDISYCGLYLGVTKPRNRSIGSRKRKLVSNLAFHQVEGAGDRYLNVGGDGIRTSDSFRFYHPDSETASLSSNEVVEALGILKQKSKGSNGAKKEEVFGGLIFSGYRRRECFFQHQNVDSAAFLSNFPGVPLAGLFCSGEIVRGNSISSSNQQYDYDYNNPHPCLHVCSSVYLVMSYTLEPLENY